MRASVKAYATPRPPESTQNHSYESRLDPDPLEAAPPAIRAAQCTRTRRRIRRDRALHRARAFFTTASSRFTPDRTRARSRTRLQTSRFENGGRDSHDARDDGRLAPRVRVVRVDRARRSQNFSFASIDAVRVERALATTCARRRVSRGRRDEDSTSAARPRRARVAGRRVFVSRRGFVTYTTRSNARVVSHENEQIRWAPRASVGRSVGRPGRWPQSRAGVRRRRERGRRRGRPWVATARAMSAPTLTNMLDARVSVITNDGRHIVGTLRGFDQVTNVILEDCAERVYSSESGVEEAPLGVYMIRGDNVCVNARRRRRGGRGIELTEDARARSNARDAKD